MTTTGGNGPSRRFPPRLLPRLTPRPSNKGGKLARTSPGCHPYGPTVPGSLTRHSGSRRPVGPAGCCGVWGCLRPLFTQATQAFSSWKIRGILGAEPSGRVMRGRKGTRYVLQPPPRHAAARNCMRLYGLDDCVGGRPGGGRSRRATPPPPGELDSMAV